MAAESPLHPMLEAMVGETRRLEGMVENVGLYIELMQREPVFVPCTLGAVLEGALARLRAEGREVPVDLAPGEALAHPLDSDSRLLGILFYHLLRNALEASREAPVPAVRVAGALEGDPPVAITVTVENNGRSPSPEEVEHLFAPFYSSNPAASGFGLPIAQLIVRQTQGELDFVPLPGEGVRVGVTLPIRLG